MVSLVAQPAMPLAIFLWHRNVCPAAELFAMPHCRVPCLWAAPPQKMICWIIWEGLSSLGLLGCCFHQMDWISSPGSDSGSVSLCVLKT